MPTPIGRDPSTNKLQRRGSILARTDGDCNCCDGSTLCGYCADGLPNSIKLTVSGTHAVHDQINPCTPGPRYLGVVPIIGLTSNGLRVLVLSGSLDGTYCLGDSDLITREFLPCIGCGGVAEYDDCTYCGSSCHLEGCVDIDPVQMAFNDEVFPTPFTASRSWLHIFLLIGNCRGPCQESAANQITVQATLYTECPDPVTGHPITVSVPAFYGSYAATYGVVPAMPTDCTALETLDNEYNDPAPSPGNCYSYPLSYCAEGSISFSAEECEVQSCADAPPCPTDCTSLCDAVEFTFSGTHTCVSGPIDLGKSEGPDSCVYTGAVIYYMACEDGKWKLHIVGITSLCGTDGQETIFETPVLEGGGWSTDPADWTKTRDDFGSTLEIASISCL